MTLTASKFYIPSKVASYLRRLLGEYKTSGESLLVEILSACRVYVVEGADYDSYDGGSYGHNVKFFLPQEVLQKVPIRSQKTHTEKLLEDLRICAGQVSNEYIYQVLFELEDDADRECQQANHVTQKALPNPDALTIWDKSCIRLFISHRDTHKVRAKELAEALKPYGISAFVAHDTIEPLEKWQKVILNGLDTMEIMLAFVTNDFHDSVWTNQEIGYALARNIPILSLKVESKDPAGFTYDVQALKGSLDNVEASVTGIYKALCKALGNHSRMQSALVDAFIKSPDWSETTKRFSRMEAHVSKLTEDELQKILSGFASNDQLHGAVYLTNRNRLIDFLSKTTGEEFERSGSKIYQVESFGREF